MAIAFDDSELFDDTPFEDQFTASLEEILSLEKDPELSAPRPSTRENLSFGVTHGTDAMTDADAFQFNEDRFRHTVILGRTGSGKSNHVQRMEREDILNGAGVFVLAAHEDDALWPLSCVPKERMDDVVLLDFANPEYLPRMNPLDVNTCDQAAVDKAIEDVIELLRVDNHYTWTGPRFEMMARDALRLIMGSRRWEDRTVLSLARIYLDPEYAKVLLRDCHDRSVRDQWIKLVPQEMVSNDSGELVHWFASRVSRFASDRTLSHVFGAGNSTFSMRDVVEQGKILVAYVPESRLGAISARTISKWLLMQLRDAIMNRGQRAGGWRGLDYGRYEGQSVREAANDPFFAYVDEFSKFATPDFEVLLAEARKQRVGLVLSTQTLSQTRTLNRMTGEVGGLEEAIVGNVGSFVCYPMGTADAERLAPQLGLPAEELRDIHRYQPLARLMVDNQPLEARTLKVPIRPAPDDPTAPRRIAHRMALDGTWVPVRGAADPGAFMRQIASVG